MSTWAEVEKEVPELAERVRRVFDAHKHKTMATLRADGAPRISGTEASFFGDDLWIGSMPDARKGADLKRDPRFALHSATVDPEMVEGDAKISGRFEIATSGQFAAYMQHLNDNDDPAPEDFDLFRADIDEVVFLTVPAGADYLLIETWNEGRNGLRRIERR
ncbi:MAG: pyridoxamine 5'-phosphate oxidase family protein [Acidimicrobiia bacterium]